MTEGQRSLQPIFILSLPRSGSTLLQRIIGSHDFVATSSEPWFLLPFFYSLRPDGVYAVYDHPVAAKGAKSFAEEYLPGGVTEYLAALREFALRLYGEAASGKPYFLDKTPRYHVIADDLIELFPSGRFIFLWRHPLAVAASMMETWCNGKWNLDDCSGDLFHGLPALIDAHRAHRDRVASVTYEELIAEPQKTVVKLLDYLDLPHDQSLVTRFSQLEMRNREYWDPTGAQLYAAISEEPLSKWRRTMANPIRKSWCRRYVRWLGAERLAQIGYQLDEILDEIDSISLSGRFLATDVPRIAVGYANRRMREHIVRMPFPLWAGAPASREASADAAASSTS